MVRTQSLTLREMPKGQNVDIELRVKKIKDTACLAPNQVRDTIIRSIFIQSVYETKMNGRFRGFLNGNPQDTVTLTFDGYKFWGGDYVTYYHNFVRGWSIGLSGRIFTAYRQARFGTQDVFAIDSSQAPAPGKKFGWTIYGRSALKRNGQTQIRYSVRRICVATNTNTLLSDSTLFLSFQGRKID
jgi:hypothetical protein